MKITISPTDSGLIDGQPSASMELAQDDPEPVEVVELFVRALIAYGSDHESICGAFEEYLTQHFNVADVDMAHC